MTTIAILLASTDVLPLRDDETYPCGFWAEELVGPWKLFADNDITITITTPDGAAPNAEPASLVPGTASLSQDECDDMRRFLGAHAAELESRVPVEDIDLSEIDGVYVPGGYAPQAQFPDRPGVAAFIEGARRRSIPVATVCHGTAALLACCGTVTPWPYQGESLTGFSDAEERTVGMFDKLTWTLETALRAAGADYRSAEPWATNVITKPGLITGQNPASSVAVARELLGQIR